MHEGDDLDYPPGFEPSRGADDQKRLPPAQAAAATPLISQKVTAPPIIAQPATAQARPQTDTAGEAASATPPEPPGADQGRSDPQGRDVREWVFSGKRAAAPPSSLTIKRVSRQSKVSVAPNSPRDSKTVPNDSDTPAVKLRRQFEWRADDDKTPPAGSGVSAQAPREPPPQAGLRVSQQPAVRFGARGCFEWGADDDDSASLGTGEANDRSSRSAVAAVPQSVRGGRQRAFHWSPDDDDQEPPADSGWNAQARAGPGLQGSAKVGTRGVADASPVEADKPTRAAPTRNDRQPPLGAASDGTPMTPTISNPTRHHSRSRRQRRPHL
jgi:hypothetical protein